MVEIRDSQNLLLSSDVALFRQQASVVMQSMREELDDHRIAINENTTEVASAYELIDELGKKLDKLSERIDEIALHVIGDARKKLCFDVKPLSGKEKEVFRAFYEMTETKAYVSYDEVARRCSLTKAIVAHLVAAMLQKGVPVLKRSDGNRTFIRLDPDFREVQAKKNLVGLDAPLSCWI